MSPEHLRGEEYTAASDVYSLGVVIWEVLTRKMPWEDIKVPAQIIGKVAYTDQRDGMPLDVVPKSTPPALTKLMTQCWASDPSDRPSLDIIKDTLDHL